MARIPEWRNVAGHLATVRSGEREFALIFLSEDTTEPNVTELEDVAAELHRLATAAKQEEEAQREAIAAQQAAAEAEAKKETQKTNRAARRRQKKTEAKEAAPAEATV